jgi:hypothetical protein
VRNIYNTEAVQSLDAGHVIDGKPLEQVPRWTTQAYRFLVATTAAGLLYAAVAQVGEYAEGPAVVRVEGRLDLTHVQGGVVSAVEVAAGDRVVSGQILVRFDSASAEQELAQLEREFELKLVRLLLNPSDETTRLSLSALRPGRQLARTRVQERTVAAPRAGVVANLRIRPGQALPPGELVLTLLEEGKTSYSLVALVPGHFRPLLQEKMPLRLELDGYPRHYNTLTIETVGNEVVGPSEVRRYLGRELGDTVSVTGSMILVQAPLPGPSFGFEGKSYRYYDGIPGRVQIRVKSDRLLVLLLPMLRGLLSHGA